MKAVILVAALLLAGCATPEPRAPELPTTQDMSATTSTTTTTTSPTTPPSPRPNASVRLEKVLDGLESPVLVLELPDGSGRLLVVEQVGRVKVARPGEAAALALDVQERVRSGGERGLLGLALHPRFAQNGVGILSYTDVDGHSVLARHRWTGETFSPDGEALLRVEQPYANHNGGHIVHGPDGFLYFGLGDGGSAGDPQDRAQDLDELLGSMLRLDVGEEGVARPAPGNPYVDREGADEVWAKGLRNPWRFSFDRETGDLWIGDVGQNAQEEIDLQPAASQGGENYGWSAWEGTRRYAPTRTTATTPIAPVATYPTEEGCAVTGGFVYRGSAAPSLRGTYLFSDYCNGKLQGLVRVGGGWERRELLDTGLRVASFGEDVDGDVYVVDHGGTVHRIVEA